MEKPEKRERMTEKAFHFSLPLWRLIKSDIFSFSACEQSLLDKLLLFNLPVDFKLQPCLVCEGQVWITLKGSRRKSPKRMLNMSETGDCHWPWWTASGQGTQMMKLRLQLPEWLKVCIIVICMKWIPRNSDWYFKGICEPLHVSNISFQSKKNFKSALLVREKSSNHSLKDFYQISM